MTLISLSDLESYHSLPVKPTDRLYCGVDNGHSGGAAIVRKIGVLWEVVDLLPCPYYTMIELFPFFEKYKDNIRMTILEQPFMCTFKKNVSSVGYTTLGKYEQTLDFYGIPYKEVPPKVWQKELSIWNTDTSTTKEQSIATAHKMTINAYQYITYQKKRTKQILNNDNFADAICMAILAGGQDG